MYKRKYFDLWRHNWSDGWTDAHDKREFPPDVICEFQSFHKPSPVKLLSDHFGVFVFHSWSHTVGAGVGHLVL